MEYFTFYLAFVGPDGGARVKKVGLFAPNEQLALNSLKVLLDELVGGLQWIGIWDQARSFDAHLCLARPANWRET